MSSFLKTVPLSDLITIGKEYLVNTCSTKAVSVSSADMVLVGIAVTKQHIHHYPDRLVSCGTQSCNRLLVNANGMKRKRRLLGDSRGNMSPCRWRISATTNVTMLTHLLATSEHAYPVVVTSQSASQSSGTPMTTRLQKTM
eukprot:622793-Pleurochrysis_carterae.AAC.2